ncbi:MAG: hypothetical protein QG608_1224, partial [Actinomycetota bacterium]|nr:hypothetical protein [Actinomycetota bacterium]
RAAPHAERGQVPVATGTAALIPDEDGRGGWTMFVNGVPCSHVDLHDPLRLDFEYVRWMAIVLDLAAQELDPLRVTHLGGAGCTLPRYVAATRPGSHQVVLELDPDVLEYAKKSFGLRSGRALRLRVADGRAGLGEFRPASQDVVLRDAFLGSTVPEHLTTVEFLDEVLRVLGPCGLYLANMADSRHMNCSRHEAATALLRFENVALIAEPAHFSGRRYGNVVLVAWRHELDVDALTRRLGCDPVRARIMSGPQVEAFVGGAGPYRDGATGRTP